jgi:GGDEF domain-containing protein
MPPGSSRRRLARPVADAPIDDLLARTDDLAKRWLIALLEQTELDATPAILGGGLTADGPALCDAVLRALADDHELRRLEPDGAVAELAARVGQLSGAASPAGAARGVEALRRTVWAALREELRRPDPDQVSELAERLALVCDTLLAAALESPAVEPPPPRHASAEPVAAPPPAEHPPVPAEPVGAPQPATPPPRVSVEPPPPVRAEPVVARSAAGRPHALWVAALEDEISHADGLPLSLLLAELEDAERILAAASSVEADATFELFAKAMRGVVRGQDILVRETDARTWIIARGTGRLGAVSLGTRVAEAVGAARWRGAPLTATVGLAVLGEDGRTSTELIEAAEEARFAASASGTDVAR